MGCLDMDGDGFYDGEDKCLKEVGLVLMKGCFGVDCDGDGVVDDVDSCLDVKGLVKLLGCLDMDGDGVVDKDDCCLNKFGFYVGCFDFDGDGVVDVDDCCLDEVGLIINKGCLEIEEEVKDVLNLVMCVVQFEIGSVVIKEEFYIVFD